MSSDLFSPNFLSFKVFFSWLWIWIVNLFLDILSFEFLTCLLALESRFLLGQLDVDSMTKSCWTPLLWITVSAENLRHTLQAQAQWGRKNGKDQAQLCWGPSMTSLVVSIHLIIHTTLWLCLGLLLISANEKLRLRSHPHNSVSLFGALINLLQMRNWGSEV